MRAAVTHRDVFLPTLAASARMKVEVIGNHCHVAKHIGNVSRDAHGREQDTRRLAVPVLSSEVGANLDAPTLWILHAVGALTDVQPVVKAPEDLLDRVPAWSEEGVGHAGVRLAFKAFATTIRRPGNPQPGCRVEIG